MYSIARVEGGVNGEALELLFIRMETRSRNDKGKGGALLVYAAGVSGHKHSSTMCFSS